MTSSCFINPQPKDTAMPQEPKRPVSELKPAELRTIVGNIQKLLWLDVEEGDGPEFWNADKEWACADLLSFIATELENARPQAHRPAHRHRHHRTSSTYEDRADPRGLRQR